MACSVAEAGNTERHAGQNGIGLYKRGNVQRYKWKNSVGTRYIGDVM